MCADGEPAGDVAGITMMFWTPTKVVTLGPWQAAQVVEPAWFISERVNLAPSGTGNEAMLEPAPTWQTSQDNVVGMWLAGMPTIWKLMAGSEK